MGIGYSTEGRPLKVIKVGMPGKQKKAIWIDGGIHAREWISPATVTYILRQFVERSGTYANILRNYDIYIMPSMNPDGYEYSRNYDRMWRKTRSNNPGSRCIGTDPNRNWGYNRVDHDEEDELNRMGQIAARAMSGWYRVGSAAKVLYPAAGGSDDWAKGGAGIKYSYTIELPDTGKYGFILPSSQIMKVAPDAFSATKAMILDLLW